MPPLENQRSIKGNTIQERQLEHGAAIYIPLRPPTATASLSYPHDIFIICG